MLDEFQGGLTPEAMIDAIRYLPHQPKPSTTGADGLLDGLAHVIDRTKALLGPTLHSVQA